MIQKIIINLTVILYLQLVDSVKLPPYFKKCSKSDSNLNECILKNIQDNWNNFIEGDNYYHLQKMKPLVIENMFVKVDDNLNGNMTQGYLNFMETFKFKFINMDLDKHHWDLGYTFDKVVINGTYKVKGKLFGLPIAGSGSTNVSFYGGDYIYKVDYKLNEKGGKQYIEIYKNFVDYENITLVKFQIRFFHSSIGEILSDALNENWRELGKEITDSVSAAFSELVTTVLNLFFDRVPFDDFFLP